MINALLNTIKPASVYIFSNKNFSHFVVNLEY